MTPVKRRHGQHIQIMPDKLDLARSALAFGHSGGCAAGCKDCRYWELCSGGDIGGDEGGEDAREVRAKGTR